MKDFLVAIVGNLSIENILVCLLYLIRFGSQSACAYSNWFKISFPIQSISGLE